MTTYNYTPDYNDGSLTRGEAIAMLDEAEHSEYSFDALEALHHLWIGHSDHDCNTSGKLASYLEEYISEACMDLDGDAIRSNGPKDSDYTGISS